MDKVNILQIGSYPDWDMESKAMGRLVRENLEAYFSGRELLTMVI